MVPRWTNSFLQRDMISMKDFRTILIDIVTEVATRIKSAEERIRNPFRNRTNVYRCEDGRPICYCCLRVGHVATYCWDRNFSCSHVSFVGSSPPASSVPVASIHVPSLGRDLNQSLADLKGIANELKLKRTSVRTETWENTPASIEHEDTTESNGIKVLPMSTDGHWEKDHCSTFAECPVVNMSQAMNTRLALDFRDVTYFVCHKCVLHCDVLCL